jgi:hypothetical protein
LPTVIEPSSPALAAKWRAGAENALRTVSMPVFCSSFLLQSLQLLGGLEQAGAARPGRMPFLTAVGSIHRATPPASSPRRSGSFSRS